MRQHRSHHSTGRRLATIGTVLLFAACTSSGTITSSSDPAADTTTTAPASTTSVAPTTAAPTTTEPIDPRLLRSDGVGATRFGEAAADVVSIISAELGAPVSDESRSYPISVGGGQFLDADETYQFIAALSRTVCWSIDFCAVFGGGDPTGLTFTGWTYSEDTSRTLHTLSGAEIGSLWSEVPSMVVNAGSGCYSQAFGTIDGVTVSVLSSGAPFVDWGVDGEPILGDPDPSEVEIFYMEAGEQPFYVYSDC